MNVEQALNAADEGEKEGLCGLYPMAAQVLAAELRMMREKSDAERLCEIELLKKDAERWVKIRRLTTIGLNNFSPKEISVWNRLIKGGWYTEDLDQLLDDL